MKEMIGDTGFIGTFVCRIRAALPMMPGIILDRICPPEEEIPEDDGLEDEMQDEVEPEDEIPEPDLILEGTSHYIEMTDLGDGHLQIQHYHQKSGFIVTSPPHSIATYPTVASNWLNGGAYSYTQYENVMTQFHNLGY